jgi:hypothetical protein
VDGKNIKMVYSSLILGRRLWSGLMCLRIGKSEGLVFTFTFTFTAMSRAMKIGLYRMQKFSGQVKELSASQ